MVYGILVDPNSVAANNLKKLSVSHGGYSFSFEDKETLDLYSSIPDNAREIDASFRDFASETPYSVTFTEDNDTPITYTLYMSTSSDDCVYVSPDGKYFMMDEAVAGKLIIREEFTSLNEFSSLPVATISSFGNEITLQPDTYSWTYTALDSSMPSLSGSPSATNPLVKFDGSQEGTLTVSFDKTPDSIMLKITDKDGVVFDDKYENLSASNRLIYTSDTELSLTLTAQWYEIEGAEYYGETSYNIPLMYDVAPTYTVVDTKGLPAGDFTVLRIKDFNEDEKLTVINDIGIPAEINVYDGNDGLKIAFIPLNCNLEKGTYTLTLKTESGHEDSVDVKVSRAVEHDSYTLLFTDDKLASAFTQENFENFKKLVADLTLESRNEHMYSGKFKYPTGSAKLAEGGAAYGTELEVISIYTNKYLHEGMQLLAEEGDEIKASNNGVVVYAGDTGIYGNTVVVDHGCSVLSYYGNLSEITAKVGDSVDNTSVIGKAGSTGFACVKGKSEAKASPMTYFAISIDGVFIDPSSPCKYGIKI